MRHPFLYFVIFIAFTYFSFFANANEPANISEMNKAKQVGKDISNSNLLNLQGFATTDITKSKVGSIINYQGTNLSETTFADGNMYEAAQKKALDEKFEPAQITKQGFLRQKEFQITHKDSFLDKANHVQKNPENYVDWLSGKYSDCDQSGGENIISSEKLTCDEYHEIRNNNCKVGQTVEVDAKHQYECVRARGVRNKVCKKELKAWCEQKRNCELENLIPINFQNYTDINPVIDNRSYCHYSNSNMVMSIYTSVNRSYTKDNVEVKCVFEVKNKKLIDKFEVGRISHRTFFSVVVNGSLAYSEGFHFNKPIKPNPEIKYNKETDTYFAIDYSPNFLPYLKEGRNEVILSIFRPAINAMFWDNTPNYGRIDINISHNCCDLKTEWQQEECK